MFNSKNTTLVLASIVAAMTLAAPAATPAQAGELPIVGTGDGMEIFQALGREFSSLNPDIKVVIPPSIGSDGAVKAVLAGTSELGRVARPLTAEENGKGLAVKSVMRIPSVIIVHASANTTGVTGVQLHGIFSGKITNWKEVGGADQPIRVIVREEGDSVFKVLKATMPGWSSMTVSSSAQVISTTTQDLIEAVRKTPGSIGFAPYSILHRSSLTMLKIDGRGPSDPAYPSAVSIGLLHGSAALSPDAAKFVEFAQSGAGDKVITWLGGLGVKP